jgi:ABC-2 type transport system ATP-binding protein
MTGVLAIRDLKKNYRKVSVLNGLNLEVAEGSVFGLIGPNGAGKTTTIKILMNLIQSTSGEAQVLGVNSRKLGPDDFARIGYVSENQILPDWMTVEYFLKYLKPFYRTWDDARVVELVDQLKLPLDRRLKNLSRGMLMKASLISSLAYHPKLLVLDEPFSGLDPMMREDFIQGLIDTAGETTILISSHDLADIESFASHIGYLDGGRLQFSEEMASLTERFREVEVIVEPVAAVPDRQWPANWLRPEATQSVVRFVDTRFDPEGTAAEIRRVFSGVQHMSFNPMPLRAIFVTLARESAKSAQEA